MCTSVPVCNLKGKSQNPQRNGLLSSAASTLTACTFFLKLSNKLASSKQIGRMSSSKEERYRENSPLSLELLKRRSTLGWNWSPFGKQSYENLLRSVARSPLDDGLPNTGPGVLE